MKRNLLHLLWADMRMMFSTQSFRHNTFFQNLTKAIQLCKCLIHCSIGRTPACAPCRQWCCGSVSVRRVGLPLMVRVFPHWFWIIPILLLHNEWKSETRQTLHPMANEYPVLKTICIRACEMLGQAAGWGCSMGLNSVWGMGVGDCSASLGCCSEKYNLGPYWDNLILLVIDCHSKWIDTQRCHERDHTVCAGMCTVSKLCCP